MFLALKVCLRDVVFFCLVSLHVCICYHNVLCSTLRCIWVILKDSSHPSAVEAECMEEDGTATRKHKGFKMEMRLTDIQTKRWTSEMDCGAAFCRTDCTVWWTCRNMTLYGVTTTIFSFLKTKNKTQPYSFSHALNDLRSGHSQTSFKMRTEHDGAQNISCVYHLKCSVVYTVHLTFLLGLFLFSFPQRCPVWLKWSQYYHLANIFCPDATNKVDISDSFFSAILFCAYVFYKEIAEHHIYSLHITMRIFCPERDKHSFHLL